MKKYIIPLAIVFVTVGLITFARVSDTTVSSEYTEFKTAFAATTATVYRSPTCGCCAGHAKAMTDAGIDVEMVSITDLVSIKDQHNIPLGMQSCHTTILRNGESEYVVEGHVPIEGIATLLETRPDVSGITLPGMPIGTPGMPGPKTEDYNIMTLQDEPELFLSL